MRASRSRRFVFNIMLSDIINHLSATPLVPSSGPAEGMKRTATDELGGPTKLKAMRGLGESF